MKTWMEQLENLIQQKHMLLNEFYKAWTCGMLSRETLQEYAQEYYHHVKAFPTYLSAIHSRCDDMEIRRSLLENLIDEEAGSPNHPELWNSFAQALGVSQERIQSHKPREQTQQLIDTFRECCEKGSLGAGVAALYCYESQIPEICKTKIEGLSNWYGMKNPEGYRYFTVHESADVEHSKSEREMLRKLVKPQDEKAVLESSEKVLNSLNNFLNSFI